MKASSRTSGPSDAATAGDDSDIDVEEAVGSYEVVLERTFITVRSLGGDSEASMGRARSAPY